jgi:hypothetical protein
MSLERWLSERVPHFAAATRGDDTVAALRSVEAIRTFAVETVRPLVREVRGIEAARLIAVAADFHAFAAEFTKRAKASRGHKRRDHEAMAAFCLQEADLLQRRAEHVRRISC